MTVVLTLLLLVVAVGAIGYPLFATRRPRDEEREITARPGGPAVFGELEADYQTGILSKEEYEELKAGRGSENIPAAGPETAPSSVDDEIERRVRQKRAGGRNAPAPARDRPSASRAVKCLKCGQPYRPGDRFCTRCGARLAGGGKR